MTNFPEDGGGPWHPGPMQLNQRYEIYEGVTLRVRAAITLRVPDSGIPEIDAMIREARRMDYAGQALGVYGYDSYRDLDDAPQAIAHDCLVVADALLAELRKGESDG